ncbi:hypothetical protein PAXRUDRAFT_830526 [Paxillus rubicundulus Ve08.2h10]|uniref:Uncharacterized protein n=1 Tax=Paxillus rubicundulus Ve08.2h10 TaxID=930991 RepID=A0A0D0DKR1_9AGAM|nr:hypothetical protein PAXRUDRAFT_830526 [Paxillus rubicundulus Ve08.2h10]
MAENEADTRWGMEASRLGRSKDASGGERAAVHRRYLGRSKPSQALRESPRLIKRRKDEGKRRWGPTIMGSWGL